MGEVVGGYVGSTVGMLRLSSFLPSCLSMSSDAEGSKVGTDVMGFAEGDAEGFTVGIEVEGFTTGAVDEGIAVCASFLRLPSSLGF